MLCRRGNLILFFFNDTATTEIYTLSLHDALPISHRQRAQFSLLDVGHGGRQRCEIGRAHVLTPVTPISRITSSAFKKNNDINPCSHTEKSTVYLLFQTCRLSWDNL